MAEYINGINLDILKWARERSGYTVDTIANAVNKDVSIVNDWESGERALTYVQLETLADKYKRPIAIFFFPEPPVEPNIAENLALRSSDNERLEPRIHILLRQAYARQLSLMELNLGTNPSEKKIFRDLQARPTDSAKELAQQARAYLNISVDTQVDWRSAKEALENWRARIEETGIFVFKEAFRNDSIDGFCLVHNEFPVICLNNSRQPVRQIFSIFHELAYLLLGENGITRGVSPGDWNIEVFSNQFTAEFLVPSDHLEPRLNFTDYDDEAIEKLANYYKVCYPVILLKLVNKGVITKNDYTQKIEGWTTKYKFHKSIAQDAMLLADQKYKMGYPSIKTSGGGNHNKVRATYLGYRFMELAFSKYRQGDCSIEELAEHLNVKVKHLPELEDRLSKRALR